MKRIVSALLVSALLWSASAAAQGRTRRQGDVPAPGPGFGRSVDILRLEPLDLSVPVLGVPYSAEMQTEVTQQFADGNRVEQRAMGSIARDGSGRIRREQTLAGFGSGGSAAEVRIVTIASPAERVQYWLDEARKIAWRQRLPPRPRGQVLQDRSILPRRPNLTTQQLAPVQFEGVKAEGTRTVLVVPQGSIGNERSIEVVNERWYSPELQVVVRTRRVDPRFGEVTYRLLNIVRAEPPAVLFDVPADFTVREQRPRVAQRRP